MLRLEERHSAIFHLTTIVVGMLVKRSTSVQLSIAPYYASSRAISY